MNKYNKEKAETFDTLKNTDVKNIEDLFLTEYQVQLILEELNEAGNDIGDNDD